MKTYNSLLYLFALVFTLSFSSCSDSDSVNSENVDLIVGEWLVVTDSDYICGTNNVDTERFADPNQIRVYNENGTWQDFEDGVPDWTGTWEYQGDGIYDIYYNDDKVLQVTGIEFPDDNTMRFGTEDRNRCDDNPNLTIYGYTVWDRQ